MGERTCSVDGCERPHYARGWCRRHYMRWYTRGTVELRRTPTADPPQCSVDGCPKPARKRGWCHMHYRRWRLDGDVGPAGQLNSRGQHTGCAVAGCAEAHWANGYCARHDMQMRRHGATGERRPWRLAGPGQRWCGHCKSYKPLSDFYRSRDRTDGLSLACAACCREKSAAARRRHPDTSRRAANNRKARKRGVKRESFTRYEIANRDGWRCGLCGKRIGRTLVYPHPRSLSIDHIVPYAAGGEHTRVNVQASHLICNLRKAAGGGGQLRLLD